MLLEDCGFNVLGVVGGLWGYLFYHTGSDLLLGDDCFFSHLVNVLFLAGHENGGYFDARLLLVEIE